MPAKSVTLFISLLLIFAVPAGLFAAGKDETPALVTIQGQIFDQDQAPVAGAKVTAVPQDGSKAVTSLTDAEGAFALALFPKTYVLKVAANGFTDISQRLNVEQNDLKTLEITLRVRSVTAIVNVEVSSELAAEVVTRTATKTYMQLRDIPQSISVVGKQQISDQSMTGIGDVVRYIPGISAHQGENNRDQIIIRGQSSSADFFINGVRDDVQYYRDLYNLESVEALRGPNAMIFGRGGGGGVINRVTKEAGFSAFRRFSLQGGSFGNKRGSIDIDQPFSDKVAFRVNSVFEDSNSFRNNVGLTRFAVNPTLTYNVDDKTSLTFSYEFARDRRTADRGITSFQNRPAEVPIETFYGNPNDSHVRSNVNLFSATLDRQFGSLSLHNRTSYGDYDRFYQNYVPGASNGENPTPLCTSQSGFVCLSAYNNATKRRNLFSQTDLNYSLRTGRVKHNLLGGFELGNQRTNNFRNTGYFNNSALAIQVAFDNPTTAVPVTFRQNAADANNHLRVNLAAAYVQDQIELSRYVQIIAGARFDYFDLTYHNDRNGDELRRIDTLVSPRVGLVIKPVTELSVYGNYSISYLPSSGDQFSSLTNITQQAEPEKFENYEVGVKWDIRRNLSFTSAIYRLDRTNTRANASNTSGVIVQTGSQRTNGLEVGLNGMITPKWIVTGGYAYQDAFITSTTTAAAAGKQVAQVPHHNFSIWNKYQLLPKLSAGLGLITRTDTFAAIDNTVVLPGYTRADAAVFYTFNENWRLQANIENLFNTKYFLNADNNTNITPGSPIGARIALTARF